MINQAQRDAIRKYFYGTRGPIILATLGTVGATILGALFAKVAIACVFVFPLLCLLAAAIWALKEKFMPDVKGEAAFDTQLNADITDLSVRALDKLGLVSEQVSMIEPIKVRGPYYDYTELHIATKQSFIKLFLKIAFWWIYIIYIGVKLIKDSKRYRPRLIFRYGWDEQTRYSMVQVNMFIFSETQVYVYTCSYDICSGEIFEENTSEYFYQDIDCVITGSKLEKIVSKKKVVNKYFEYFKVIVTSGTSTSAIADGTVSILNTQVKGMRELIRNKKEEITL